MVNDAPTIVVTANDFTENAAAEHDVAATYVTADEEGDTLTVSFTGSNAAGYYALVGGQVELTAAGAAWVNGGNALPAIALTVTDDGSPNLSGTGSDTPDVTVVNDAPTIVVTANDFTENAAAEHDVAATYVTADEEGDTLTVSFTAGSNAAGYYALVGGQVELTAAGAAWVNGGNALPAIALTVTDDGSPNLSGTGSDTPDVTVVNDAPTIVVTANDFTENAAAEHDVAATYVTADEEGDTLTVSFTAGSNAAGYYALVGGQVELTAAGAAWVNGGNALPAIAFTVTDDGSPNLSGTGSDTPDVTVVNDAPTIVVTANDFTENAAAEHDVAATYVTADEEGDTLTGGFTAGSNAAGYYALVGGQVELTAAGAAWVNGGNALPAIALTVTDDGSPNLSGTGSDTPDVTVVNDAPTIVVTANDFTENAAAEHDVAATYVTADEEGDTLTVSFTAGSNAAGYYALVGGQVELTAAGAAWVNGGNALPAIALTVTDDGSPNLSGTGSDTPDVTVVNDAPTIVVTANDFTENAAAEHDVAATYVTADEEGDTLTVSFTAGSNAAGYYALVGGQVELTAAGAAWS